ncbi:hypothetical protein [Streptomyces mangrovisoli]|uniref:hypothetical protein n=1 Tax=Streptomyces mangrovisoli TaxID=1428628 RepID=UPI0011603012|nr:hypothetical protein [Streptomyces mangrovisoli]
MAEAENNSENAVTENAATEIDQERPASGGDSASSEGNSTNREAAKYRTKLREAEGKLEAAEARVTALLHREIEAHAAKVLAVGADLFDIGGASVDDLTDPEGNVMPDAVNAAAEALLAKRPGLGNPNRPWGDVGGNHPASGLERQTTMRDVINEAIHKR